MRVLSFLIAIIAIYIPLTAVCDTKDIFMIESETGQATLVSVKLKSGRVISLTNAHMCNDTKFVVAPKATRKLAIVVNQSKIADLCELTSVSDTGYTLSDSYSKGDAVKVIGYPMSAYKVSSGNLGEYMIIRKEEVINGGLFGNLYVNYSGTVDEGSSGSPALNSNNEIVGLIALVSQTGRTGKLVPLEFIKQFLGEL